MQYRRSLGRSQVLNPLDGGADAAVIGTPWHETSALGCAACGSGKSASVSVAGRNLLPLRHIYGAIADGSQGA
jgi:hypothetical protein